MSASSCISFVGIVDFSEQAHWLFLSESVSDLLGYEPSELVNTPSLDLAHPDEIEPVRKLHYDTITQDKAAALVYMRLRHKDPYRGYILCAITRTITYNVVVGSVSYASTGPKAMHNASTAQEVTVITPSARKGFEFRRWGDPSPMHPTALSDSEDGESTASDASDTEKEEPIDSKSPTDGPLPDCQQRGPPVDRDANGASSPTQSPSPPTQTSEESGSSPRSQSSGDDSVSSDNSPRTRNPSQSRRDPSPAPVKVSRRRRPPRPYVDEPAITYAPLPKQSMRTALFLDRFSRECKIEYCSNDNFVQTTQVMGRPFFDFVMKKDEELVRSWIEAVKAWGVNERGQPSDGGFGYGKFTLYLPGRNSSEQDAEQNRGRHRRGSRGAGISDRQERRPSSHSAAPRPSSARPHPRSRTRDEMRVDAIFSAYSDGLMVIIRHAKH